MTRSLLPSCSAFPLLASVLVLALGGCQSAADEKPVQLVRPPVSPDISSYGQLESRVVALESQMHAAQPTLRKVEAIETHFKALSLELDRIAKDYPEAADVVGGTSVGEPVLKKDVTPKKKPVVKAVAPVEPSPEKAKETLVKKEPVLSSPAELAVTSVRIGEQGKATTRIVLDTTKPAELRYDLDNGEGLLVIDVPTAKWVASESSVLTKSPMVKSFHATTDEAGAHLVIELKQTAKVTATARLTPSGTSGHRVYVDVAPVK